MRRRIVAVALAAMMAIGWSVPAFADEATSAAGVYTCDAAATVTRDGTRIFSSSTKFQSPRDVSASYSKTYAYNGSTYTATATVSCHR